MDLEKTFKHIEEILKELKTIDTNEYPAIEEYMQSDEKWNMKGYLEEESSNFDGFGEKSLIIQNKMKRTTIKISMFGGTSVGKSQVCNAIIGKLLFEGATAHKTSCFVQIQNDSKDYSLKWGEKSEKTFLNFDDFSEYLDKLTDATESNCLVENDTLCVGIKDCSSPILQKGKVILLDTPGVNNKKELNICVEKEALDSDIFLFVLNCCVSDENERFFKYQSEVSSKPDVFILINKWDNSDEDNEELTQRSKESIKKQCLKFLLKQGCDRDSASSRIAFISAREMIQINEQNLGIDSLDEKQTFRYKEYQKFESNLRDYTNKLEENKNKMYQSEIEDICGTVTDNKSKMKQKILSLKSSKVSETFTKHIEELDRLREEIGEKIEKEKLKLNIRGEFSSIKASCSESQAAAIQTCNIIEKIEKKIKQICDEIDDYTKKSLKEIFRAQENMKKHTKIHNYAVQKTIGSSVPIEALVAESSSRPALLTTISPYVGSVVKCMKTAAFAVGVTATAFVAEKAWDFYISRRTEKAMLGKIEAKEYEVERYINCEMDELLKYFEKLISDIKSKVEDTKEKYESYWKKIEKALRNL